MDKYIVLSFDEMKIQQDLVFNKHSCSTLGFTDLGDVSNTLDNFEQCKGEGNDMTDNAAFMVREFPYAHFPTKEPQVKSYFQLYGMVCEIWRRVG